MTRIIWWNTCCLIIWSLLSAASRVILPFTDVKWRRMLNLTSEQLENNCSVLYGNMTPILGDKLPVVPLQIMDPRVQWKTPDDGHRNCPKHVEFHFKNKFEKSVHLVGFIIRNLSRCTVTWTANSSHLLSWSQLHRWSSSIY